jgi:hypothetical protein
LFGYFQVSLALGELRAETQEGTAAELVVAILTGHRAPIDLDPCRPARFR